MFSKKFAYPFHFPMRGKSVQSLFEFLETLEELSEHEFRHFVTREKNDFASWIYACTENRKLADNIKKLDNIHELKKYIKELIIHNIDKIVDAEDIFIEPHKHIIVKKQGDKFEITLNDETFVIDKPSHEFLQKISYKPLKHAKKEIMGHFKVLEEEANYNLISALEYLMKHGLVKLKHR